jgi:hypothetical protein
MPFDFLQFVVAMLTAVIVTAVTLTSSIADNCVHGITEGKIFCAKGQIEREPVLLGRAYTVFGSN